VEVGKAEIDVHLTIIGNHQASKAVDRFLKNGSPRSPTFKRSTADQEDLWESRVPYLGVVRLSKKNRVALAVA
jgi:hypothetical protein